MHLRSLGRNHKVIIANYRVCRRTENYHKARDHSANTRGLECSIDIIWVNSRGPLCISKLLGPNRKQAEVKFLFFKYLKVHHWRDRLFFSLDLVDDHGELATAEQTHDGEAPDAYQEHATVEMRATAGSRTRTRTRTRSFCDGCRLMMRQRL